MTTPAAAPAETLLCDTSFVSVMQTADRNQALISSWPPGHRRRLDQAVLAISVITLGELRAGHAYARWEPPRRQRAETLIGAYVLVPLDVPTLNCYAEAWATCRRTGRTIPENDLWIAAAAIARGWTLVSCDRHFDDLDGLEHIYLPPRLT